MNTTQWFTSKVLELMRNRGISHSEAWLQTAKQYPDAATIFRAAGQTGHQISRFNSKIANAVSTKQRQQFANEVYREMREAHTDYGTAFNRVNARSPKPFVEIQLPNSRKAQRFGARPQFSNDNPSIAGNTPSASPQFKALFHLPVDATTQEWETAWKGNGGTASPVSFGKVFDALCGLYQDQKNLDYEGALRACKLRFPQLWETVEQLSKMKY